MRTRTIAAIFVCLAAHTPPLRSAGQRPATRPNILLITLDTVRADRMGFLGSTRNLTPSLDKLASESIVFTRAYAQAPTTTVSHATILTGTFPPFHGVRDFGTPLSESAPYLPDVLHHAGYRTAAFVGSLILDPRNGAAPGFGRGFDVYDAGFRLRQPGEDRYTTAERRGDEVVARVLAWLAANGGDPGRNFFLWVHLFDAHDPYDPPGDLKTRFAATPYDGEIASVDRLVGRLAQAAGASTAIFVAADHGEALGDHGEDTHGVFLYDATLHVPLLMRLPGTRAGRVAARVRLADLAPTALNVAGVPVPPAMQGESLLPLIRDGAAPQDRPAYAETNYPRQAFGWSPLMSWRADGLLFVHAPRRELYDEKSDHDATRNLAGAERAVADRLDREIEQFVRRAAAAGSAAARSSDPQLAQRLASLGYLGGGGAGSAPTSDVDPKDRIQTANALRLAIADVEDAEFRRAIPRLERVTASEPTIAIAQLSLGVARARLRQYAGAIDALQKALALDPDATIAHYELGSALYETGDLKAAAGHFAAVASRLPQWADARYSLGSVYARIDRVPDAIVELRAALGLEPRHFRANLLLGRIFTLQGQASTALKYLQTSVEVQPANAEAHRFLADAYEKTGNAAAAAQERQRAQDLSRK